MRFRFLDHLNALPGPIWLFGAFGFSRLWAWSLGLLSRCENGGSVGYFPETLLFLAAGLAAALTPLLLLWMLTERKAHALWLMRWYAGLKALVHVAGLLSPLLAEDATTVFSDTETLPHRLFVQGTWCLLWLGFLRYLERSRTLAAWMPKEPKGVSWQSVLLWMLLFLLALTGM